MKRRSQPKKRRAGEGSNSSSDSGADAEDPEKAKNGSETMEDNRDQQPVASTSTAAAVVSDDADMTNSEIIPIKRKPGRPRIHPIKPIISTVKNQRGRPIKYPLSKDKESNSLKDSSGKKKRGRPFGWRKYPISEDKESLKTPSSNSAATPMRKRPGRPPGKYPKHEKSVSSFSGRPGLRPRKSVRKEETTGVEAGESQNEFQPNGSEETGQDSMEERWTQDTAVVDKEVGESQVQILDEGEMEVEDIQEPAVENLHMVEDPNPNTSSDLDAPTGKLLESSWSNSTEVEAEDSEESALMEFDNQTDEPHSQFESDIETEKVEVDIQAIWEEIPEAELNEQPVPVPVPTIGNNQTDMYCSENSGLGTEVEIEEELGHSSNVTFESIEIESTDEIIMDQEEGFEFEPDEDDAQIEEIDQIEEPAFEIFHKEQPDPSSAPFPSSNELEVEPVSKLVVSNFQTELHESEVEIGEFVDTTAQLELDLGQELLPNYDMAKPPEPSPPIDGNRPEGSERGPEADATVETEEEEEASEMETRRQAQGKESQIPTNEIEEEAKNSMESPSSVPTPLAPIIIDDFGFQETPTGMNTEAPETENTDQEEEAQFEPEVEMKFEIKAPSTGSLKPGNFQDLQHSHPGIIIEILDDESENSMDGLLNGPQTDPLETGNMRDFEVEEEEDAYKDMPKLFPYGEVSVKSEPEPGPSHRVPPRLTPTVKGKSANKKKMCLQCGKELSKAYMSDHMRTHTGERPYICSICRRGFKTQTHLSRHTKQVHGLKLESSTLPSPSPEEGPSSRIIPTETEKGKLQPVHCPICDQTFANTSSMYKHLKLVHPDETPFTCDVCSKSFLSFSDLYQHRMKSFRCQGKDATCLPELDSEDSE